MSENIQVIVHCDGESFKNISEWPEFKHFLNVSNVQIEFESMKNSPIYDENTRIQSVKNWLKEFENQYRISKDFVIIDNDVSLLNVFPNACLMGSFLWPVVNKYGNSENLKKLSEWEIEILEVRKPSMLCVEGMTMPEMDALVNRVELPWFVDPSIFRENRKERNSILITGGGTSKLTEILLDCAHYLEANEMDIYVDKKLYESSRGALKLFNFDDEDYSRLKCVVCRPGMGTLNDSVKHGMGVFGINDCSNKEMEFNIQQIVKKGMGVEIQVPFSKESLLKSIQSFDFLKAHQNILKEKTGGAKAAATWILKNDK